MIFTQVVIILFMDLRQINKYITLPIAQKLSHFLKN